MEWHLTGNSSRRRFAVRLNSDVRPDMQIPIEFTNSQSWLLALQQRKTIAAAPATYILFQAKSFGRLCGTSNILYIGHTGQLGGESDSCRLRIYRYPNGSHAHELRHRTQQLINSGLDVRLCWTHVLDLVKKLDRRYF